MDQIAVIGLPSNLGGADTELGHQILCWLKMGVEVHICHTGGFDLNAEIIRSKYSKLGCKFHTPKDWASIAGMHSISFCNDVFLRELPEIKKHVKTASFVNCMTWNFDQEIEMQSRGLIDFHLYQTKHAFDNISPKLQPLGTYRPLFMRPYFHTEEYPFIENRSADRFRFGRISRADPGKFNNQQLWIYDTMVAPIPKAGLILGWSDQVEKKFNTKPPSFVAAMPEGWTTQQEFYKFCDVIIMSTDTFENLPRVGFEAMASGSVLVVDNKGGWTLQVENGKTGWLCDNNREFVYKASRAAFEVSERNDMRHLAHEKLINEWGMQSAMDSWDQIFKEWDKIK